MGRPASRSRACASGCAGTRMPTVSRPAVTCSGMRRCLGRTRFSGPGQERRARVSAVGGHSATMTRAMSMEDTCTMTGLVGGRPLASKIRATADSSRALAPSPYTVSVGNATRRPARSSAAARTMSSCSLRDILFPVAGGFSRFAPHQKRVDELVNVAVQHAIHVADGQLAAQILDETVGCEHVVADLTAEVDVQLGVFELVLLDALLRHLVLVQARFE